ncbi:permease [Paraliomyxa miuraensis]|uniref:permease n=1 Tax=Paraliomyxa miuraensis TaxID=376150 RepID=UPI0022516D06|nr:permease [Paraliomyxa miuraensis]MCX4240371.1 permease [Paraliomyxa miuraensis]
MFGPMMVTLGAVAVGAMLALATARGHVVLGALRTFAALAVVTAVLVQLLPEAVQELGAVALGVFAGALVLPRFVAILGRMVLRSAGLSVRGVGAELGFYGFLLHQWAEGLALGTFVGDGHGHGDLVLGMAAHTIPLTAVFVAATLSARGRRSALRGTGALLLATALGFAAAGTISASAVAGILPWLSAAVAGFLCHILLHDEGLSVRRAPLAGALDVVGGLCGVALPLLAVGMHRHAPHEGHEALLRAQLGETFGQLWAGTAPMLLLGLVLGVALQQLGSRVASWPSSAGGVVRQGLRGIAIGARLPLCAYGVPSLAETLRKRGAGPALVVAFVVSTPELGPATVTLTYWFLGTTFVWVRIAAAAGVAFVAAMLFSRLARTWPGGDDDEPSEPVHSVLAGAPSPRPVRWSTTLALFDELLLHIAPWAFVWIVAATYVKTVIPAGSLVGLADTGGDLLVIALMAVPSYVCAASATPLAAVLLLEGISPGAVLVGLLVGPATNLATIGMLRRGYGGRAVALGLAAVLLLAVATGALVNLLEVPVRSSDAWGHEGEPSVAALGSMAVLAVMLLRQLWRWGTHPWFEILDAGSHGHGHGHEHHRPEHPGHEGYEGHAHDHDPSGRHHHAHDHDHIPGLPGLDRHEAGPEPRTAGSSGP